MLVVTFCLAVAIVGAGAGAVVRAIIWGAAWAAGIDFVANVWWFVGGGAIAGFVIALLCIEGAKCAFRELVLR